MYIERTYFFFFLILILANSKHNNLKLFLTEPSTEPICFLNPVLNFKLTLKKKR